MFEDTVLERDQGGHESIEGSPSAPVGHEPNVTSERAEVTARAPAQGWASAQERGSRAG